MQSTTEEEKVWLVQLQANDEKALQSIFDRYYKYLVVTAYRLINDDHQARDIVQDVFFNLWKKRAAIQPNTSLKAYLRQAVVNRTIDIIRSRKRMAYQEDMGSFQKPSLEASAQQQLEEQDLQLVLQQAINQLPERCREIFALSRFEHKSHKEIAETLNISVKTIENQMTKALKIIRATIEKYAVVLWWIFSSIGGMLF